MAFLNQNSTITDEVSRSDTVAIGIDFGAANITIAAMDGGELAIVRSRQGGEKLPAYVAHLETDVLIGEDARSCALTDPEQVLFCMKRFLGLNTVESLQTAEQYRFPFQVGEYARGVCDFGKYRIDVLKAVRILLKEASAAIDESFSVFGPVAITVPDVYWENEERKKFELIFTQMIESAITAGLPEPVLIPEIHAALLGSRSYSKGDSVLIIHTGAAYFGVAFYNANRHDPEILKTDQIICGNDFDVKIINHFAVAIQKGAATIDKQTYEILRKHCQKAKMDLSASRNSTVNIEEIANEHHRFVFTRNEFETCCSDLFDKFKNFLSNDIKNNYPNVTNVTDILLTGGCARIPKIQQIIWEIFGKRPNPAVLGLADTVTAYGAALYAKGVASGNLENVKFNRPLPVAAPREYPIEPQLVSDEPARVTGLIKKDCTEQREIVPGEHNIETAQPTAVADSVPQIPEFNHSGDKDNTKAPSVCQDVSTTPLNQICPHSTKNIETLIEEQAKTTNMDTNPVSTEVQLDIAQQLCADSLNAVPIRSPDENQSPAQFEPATLTEEQHEDSTLTPRNEEEDISHL